MSSVVRITGGAIPIPDDIMARLQLEEGDLVIVDAQLGRRLLIMPVPELVRPPSVFPPEQKAAFLLDTAVTEDDYRAAGSFVRDRMGLDPDTIPHSRRP